MRQVRTISRSFILGIIVAGVFACAARAESPFLKQGIEDYNAGDYQSAISHFGAALASDFNNAVLHYYMASSFVHMKLKDDAIREFRIAYALQPDAEVGKFSKQALGYLGVETDSPKPDKPAPPPPHIVTPEERTASALQMQADQLKAVRTGLGQQFANDIARRGDDTVRRTGNDILNNLPYRRYGTPQMPADAQRQLDLLRGMFNTQKANALRNGQVEAEAIQRSAENLQYLLNQKSGHHLDPVGTNLYIRNYKGDKDAPKSVDAPNPKGSDSVQKTPETPPALKKETPKIEDKSIWGKILQPDGKLGD
jgi:tetratricopeptide (TPR) repeat protein